MYRMIGCDNPQSAGHKFIGKEHEFTFHGVAFYFGSIQSSRVSLIEATDNVLRVTTKNTVYVFQRT